MQFTVQQIADLIDGHALGDHDKIIKGVAPFDNARSDQITFAASPAFVKKIESVAAGAIIIPASVDQQVIQSTNVALIQVSNPQLAFAKTLDIFFPREQPAKRTHPSAIIGLNFKQGRNTSIGPSVVIGNDVHIGHGTIIHPGVVLGNHVRIGDDTVVYPNVTILKGCRLGHRVIIHAGSVIGSDGYGFAPDGSKYYKIQQTGIVQIDDDVEIGANNTIDRATFGKTWIQKGVKTDNLVHIAHNVTVGEDTVIVAQVGISGSVSIGKHVTMAGQAGISGHLTIGDNAVIGPQAGVTRSIESGTVVSGTPEMPHKLWLRVQNLIRSLPELKKRIIALEKKC